MTNSSVRRLGSRQAHLSHGAAACAGVGYHCPHFLLLRPGTFAQSSMRQAPTGRPCPFASLRSEFFAVPGKRTLRDSPIPPNRLNTLSQMTCADLTANRGGLLPTAEKKDPFLQIQSRIHFVYDHIDRWQ